MERLWRLITRLGISTFIINKVWDVMQRYEEDSSFKNIKNYELCYLPFEYYLEKVKPLDLADVWFKLPLKYRNEERLQKKLPCFEHYNLCNWETHIDGPPSAKEDCSLCNTFNN